MTLRSLQQKLNLTRNFSPYSEKLTDHINKKMDEITRDAVEQNRYYCRKQCFPDESFFTMTFAGNAEKNTRAYEKALKYAENFKVFREKNAGMIFLGPCGTGKTYLAACVANALIDQGKTCKLITMETALREMRYAEDKGAYLKGLTAVDLLIIDDFGAEYDSDFAMAMAFEIINARYMSRGPLIVTTNFTKEEITNPEPKYGRIMSRLWEICVPISFEGEDLRKLKMKRRLDKMRENAKATVPPAGPTNAREAKARNLEQAEFPKAKQND